MVSLVMLAIMAGCAVFLYLKGTFVQGLTMVFNAIIASFIALAFFEFVADLLIKQAPGMAPWGQMICSLLLFILTLAVLQTAAMQIGKEKVNLGLWPERVGRIVSGILVGYVITGQLLVAGAMAPLPKGYPYARFPERNIDASKPGKALLNPDGFITGLFGTISKGSFSPMGEPKSFAMLHAGYLDHLYLNRHSASSGVSVMTSTEALSLERKAGVWEAPSGLRDTDGETPPNRPGHTLMLVRVGIKKNAIRDAGKFTLSQLRLVCGPQGQAPLAGGGTVAYPIGYIGAGGRLDLKPLSETLTIQASDIPDNKKDIDFAFFVPAGTVPRLLGFKLNNIEQVSAIATGDEVPEVISYRDSSDDSQTDAQPEAAQEQP